MGEATGTGEIGVKSVLEDVSRETISALEDYADLLLHWTTKINLIAPSTRPDIWHRHIVDSAQIYPSEQQDGFHWLDIGSGGGLPGVVCAIIARERHPHGRFTLIESDARKSVFLRTALRELKIDATVLTQRVERAKPQNADIMSARALSALSILLEHADRHLSPNGTALFMKGARYAEEITEARQKWAFELVENASITDPAARILQLRNISRVD